MKRPQSAATYHLNGGLTKPSSSTDQLIVDQPQKKAKKKKMSRGQGGGSQPCLLMSGGGGGPHQGVGGTYIGAPAPGPYPSFDSTFPVKNRTSSALSHNVPAAAHEQLPGMSGSQV